MKNLCYAALMFQMSQAPPSQELQSHGGGFHTTHWSVIMTAREAAEGSSEAVAALYSRYWYPIYAYIRRTGASSHQAEDLAQDFFCKVLQRDWLANVHPVNGRFRSFLLTCVKNFLANERDKSLAAKRGGGYCIVSFHREEAETRYSLEPADPVTPEVLFERRWVYELLDQTLRALRFEYEQTKRLDLFEDLQSFLPGGKDGISRADLAQKRGLTTNAVDVAIHRMRQRFGLLLRNKVAETVSSESEVDEELRHLISVLGH